MTTYFIISVILMVVFLVISIIEDKKITELTDKCKHLQAIITDLKMEQEINHTAEQLDFSSLEDDEIGYK